MGEKADGRAMERRLSVFISWQMNYYLSPVHLGSATDLTLLSKGSWHCGVGWVVKDTTEFGKFPDRMAVCAREHLGFGEKHGFTWDPSGNSSGGGQQVAGPRALPGRSAMNHGAQSLRELTSAPSHAEMGKP